MLSIKEINQLQAENKRLTKELETATTQYNKVVAQNKAFQQEIKDLKEMYCIG